MQRPGVRRQRLVDIGGAWRGEVRRRAIIVRRWSGDHGRGGAEVVLSGPQRKEARGHKKRTRRGYSMRDGLREGRNLSAEEGGE